MYFIFYALFHTKKNSPSRPKYILQEQLNMKKTKSLHLFLDYLCPTEIWLFNLLKNMEGNEIHIGALHFKHTNFFPGQFHYCQWPLDSVMHFSSQLDKSRPLELLQKIAIHGLQTIVGNYFKFLHSYIKEHKIELVHAHFGSAGYHFLPLTKKLELPYFISFYGYDYESLPLQNQKWKNYHQKIFKGADLVICEGPFGAETIRKKGCPAEKIAVAPLGVEPAKIPAFSRTKKKGQLNLLQIASFTEKKGQIYSIQAFERALSSCPDMTLTIVGNDRQPAYKASVIEYLQKNRPLKDKVLIKSFIDYNTLHPFMSNFHVFIHPSCYSTLRDCEGGAPIVLMDAQATGMPVIATKHCDIPHITKNENTAILAEEKNIEQLAAAIEFFYWMDQPTYDQWGQNARLLMESKFDITQNAKHLTDLYYKKAR